MTSSTTSVPVGGASSSATSTCSSNGMPVGGAFGVVGGLVDAIARDAGSASDAAAASSSARSPSSASNVGKRPPTHRQSNTSTTGSSGNSNHQSIAESRVDFIAEADAVKSLFALPLLNDVGVNIALHNIGNGTLLMDAAHDTVASYDEVEDTANIGAGNAQRNRRRRRRPRSVSGENIFASRPALMAAGTTSTTEASCSSNADATMAIVSAALEQQQQQQQQTVSHAVLTEKVGEKAANKVLEFARSNGGTALMVAPSNALAATAGATETPILGGEASPRSTLATSSGRSASAQDPISDMLPPPEHYVADVMVPPQQPRQYLDFKFHEMNLKVASDAVICRPTNNFEDGANNNGPNQDGMAVRVTDVQDLRAQMKHYQDTKRLKASSSSTTPSPPANFNERRHCLVLLLQPVLVEVQVPKIRSQICCLHQSTTSLT